MLGQVHDIDVKLLRVFQTVARRGGLVSAQTELGTSLSNVSMQIKQLEERLGARLCERGNRGFFLTPAGHAILRASERLFASIDDFRNDVAEVSRLPVGEVRLGLVDNLTANPACRVHEGLTRLLDAIPGANVQFMIAPPNELELGIVEETLDLAIGIFPKRKSTIEYTPIFRENHELYCARNHPLFALNDAEIDLGILAEHDYASWSYLEPHVGKATAKLLKPSMGTAFIEGVASLIRSGRYIGFLPDHFAGYWTSAGEIRPILAGRLRREVDIQLIWRCNRPLKRVALELRELLCAVHGVDEGRDRPPA